MRGGRFSIAVCVCLVLGAAAAAPAGAVGFLDEWGTNGSGPGQFGFPVGVAVDGSGHVYVADSENDRIEKFDEAGKFLGAWGSTGSGVGQFKTPEGVAVDAAGDVYVVDLGNARVEKFDSAGNFLLQWGREGSGPGQFKAPQGVAVGPSGDVYVVDAVNDRVSKFTSTGALLTEWGGFKLPDGVAVDSAGSVYVADSEGDRVARFGADGAFAADWGGPATFSFPIGVATAGNGHVYVSDSGRDQVQEFTLAGKPLSSWGAHGNGPGQFSSPVALAVGPSGRVFVADAGNDRIEVFGELPAPEYGKTFNLAPVSGVVKVKLPGSKKFIDLAAGMQLPLGTIVDTSLGRVRLTSAKGPGGGSQSADFFDGRFKVLQSKHGPPITILKLANPVSCGGGKSGRPAAVAARRKGRGLWGSGKGNFRSEGRHGSATVRGTIWWAQDRCDGTKFKVKRGVVTIRDFTSHKTLKLHKGQTYLAPAG